MKKLFIFLIISATILSSCYRDVASELYPPDTSCDTSNTTYATTILPVLQNNTCIGCHSTVAPSGNIILDTYSGVKSAAQSGKLYGSIAHSSGYSAMPPSGTKISDCDLNKVNAWINKGMLNN